LHLVGQPLANLVPQDASRRQVVAVTKSARQAEDLELAAELRIFQETIDMDRLGSGAGQLKGVRRFQVAVGAGGSED